MSIAYLDPGNIESDLQSGALAEYKVRDIITSVVFVTLHSDGTTRGMGAFAPPKIKFLPPFWPLK